MLIFIKLFLAHLIGDFILQSNKWVVDKELNKLKSKYLYFHVIIHFEPLNLVEKEEMDYYY